MKRVFSLILAIVSFISVFSLSSCAKKKDIVMTIEGEEVSYDMVRYFVMNYKDLLSEDELENEEIINEIAEKSLNSLKELYVYKKLARERNLSLSESKIKEIDEIMEAFEEEYDSKKEYKKALAQYNVTEDVLREINEIEALCDLLYDDLTTYSTIDRFKSDNATIDADLKSGKWFSAEYIMITYSSEDKEDKNGIALVIKDEIVKGSEMQQIYDLYVKDYENDISYSKDGCFTYSIYNESFEKVVESLEIGEVSDVIEYGDNGETGAWFIVKRLPIDNDFVDENYISSIIPQYLAREFFNYISEESEKAEVVFTEKYKDFNIGTIS